ncbi:MAG: substrate-binding domain-containing protein, partial [Ardenticatenaceae bacterium]
MQSCLLPRRTLVALLLLVVLLLAACGGGAQNTGENGVTGGDAEEAVTEPTEEMVQPTEEMAEATEEPTDGEMAGEGMLPAVNPLEASGDILVAGSSTVFPLTEAMAERFKDEGFSGEISIDSVGTGGGFERFCVNVETDISNASRPIEEEEAEACRAN